jgi:tripartite-type tricarboxylate transporter receptor subunit TctC
MACALHVVLSAVSVSCAAAMVAAPAVNAWPERPVRLVVAVAAGGPTDDLARLIASSFSERFGGSFFVENRGGGGGRIGIGSVARAEPDGHTILVAASSLTISVAMSNATPYDPLKDFAPIALIATTPTSFSVKSDLGVATIADLVALSSQRPEALNYATPGTGTVGHLAAELLKIRSGLRMAHVPHTGAGPAVQSLLSNAVQVLATPVPAIQSQVEAGSVKALAVTSAKRWPKLPGVPTMIESGYSGFIADTFFGLLAPAKTPPDIVGKLTSASLSFLAQSETVARLQHAGYDVSGQGPIELTRRIEHELDLWRSIVKQAGIGTK